MDPLLSQTQTYAEAALMLEEIWMSNFSLFYNIITIAFDYWFSLISQNNNSSDFELMSYNIYFPLGSIKYFFIYFFIQSE